jgi:hypothetical protein
VSIGVGVGVGESVGDGLGKILAGVVMADPRLWVVVVDAA